MQKQEECSAMVVDGRRRWYKSDDDVLLTLYSAAKTVSVIAKEMGRSHSAIASWLAYLNGNDE